MKNVVQLNKWANAHTTVYIDVLRVATGLFLLLKGAHFANQSQDLTEILGTMGTSVGASFILVHYVAMSHLVGGLFICIGLLTRLSLCVQLPILVGAVAVNFIGVMNVENLIQASSILFLSIFFLFYGSGKHSADYSLKLNM